MPHVVRFELTLTSGQLNCCNQGAREGDPLAVCCNEPTCIDCAAHDFVTRLGATVESSLLVHWADGSRDVVVDDLTGRVRTQGRIAEGQELTELIDAIEADGADPVKIDRLRTIAAGV